MRGRHCAGETPPRRRPGPDLAGSVAPLAAQAATHLEGTLGPGALYSIDVPADWNGDLVLYAHGYTLPQLPVGPPTTDNFAQIRAGVLARHFAFAVSSFSENGYVVAEEARQLHQLRGVFSDRIAAPKRTMLLGFSLRRVDRIEARRDPPQFSTQRLSTGQWRRGWDPR